MIVLCRIDYIVLWGIIMYILGNVNLILLISIGEFVYLLIRIIVEILVFFLCCNKCVICLVIFVMDLLKNDFVFIVVICSLFLVNVILICCLFFVVIIFVDLVFIFLYFLFKIWGILIENLILELGLIVCFDILNFL